MKNKIKMIISFTLGAMVFAGIGAFAAIQVQANQIGYNNTTVADALDGMYRINGFQTDYSETEKVVGKWIDGKPLYQKTWDFDTAYSNNANPQTLVSNFISTYNIDKIIDINGIFRTENGQSIQTSNGVGSRSYIGIVDGNLSLYISGSGSSWYPIVSVQYTKTTDTASN